MKVYCAIVHVNDGEFVIVSHSEAGREHQLAIWCRDSWAEYDFEDEPQLLGTDRDAIGLYFDRMCEIGGAEWCTYVEEIVHP